MKSMRPSVLWIWGGAAAAALVIFNVFAPSKEISHFVPVSPWSIVPFGLLLVSIALAPFLQPKLWERFYDIVAFGLGAVVVFYYVVVAHNGQRMFLSSYEYLSFISLIGSLYVVAGGIHIEIGYIGKSGKNGKMGERSGMPTPLVNVALLASGSVLANIVGTTGASMVLIRPYLRLNKHRIHGFHIAFFIFLVSNIGGALTPVGNPPLLLGFLKGVPFFWIATKTFWIWVLTTSALLGVFLVVDYVFYRKEPAKAPTDAETDETKVTGLFNVALLFVIVAAVFLDRPVPLLLRELIMIGAAVLSYMTTNEEIHRKNDFHFFPLREVAILFAGIFATIVPALDWMEANSLRLGMADISYYYWGTGLVSGILDSAPAYLASMSAAFGLHGASLENLRHVQVMTGMATPESFGLTNPLAAGALPIVGESWKYIQAISVASVFFGACTYIGNGPNFLVKSIAEHAGFECPHFFEYIYRYTVPILLPTFIIVWYFFFRT